MDSKAVDIHIGKKLKEMRNICNFTQKALGEMVGVAFQQIQKYEIGVNRISCSRIYKLSKALSVDVSYFFSGLDNDIDEDELFALHFQNTVLHDKTEEFKHKKISESKINNHKKLNSSDVVPDHEVLLVTKHYKEIMNPGVRCRVLELIKSLSEL